MSLAYALVAAGRGHLVNIEVAEPSVGEVVVEVTHNGVCASDLNDWVTGTAVGTVPSFGHEPVGRVVSTGPGANLPIGAWVTGRIDHSYAQRVVALADDLVVVPDDLDPSAAVGEPIGCVEGLRRTKVSPGDRVAVIGAGFMGRVALQLLAHAWTSKLVAVDTRPDARRGALDDGADYVAAPADVNESFDVVVEASGTQPGLDLATALVGEHGTLSILGYHQTTRSVDMAAWNFKAIDIVSAHVRDPRLLRESTRRGLQLAAAGRLDIARLVTHRFPLAAVDAAFSALSDKPAGFVKAVIDFT